MPNRKLFILLILFILPVFAKAQINRDYILATQLMQRSDYQSASLILERLINDDPVNTQFVSRYMDCLIQLKEYEDAKQFLDKPLYRNSTSIQLQDKRANILYLSKDTSSALNIWDKIIEQNRRNTIAYQIVAQSLAERKDFEKSAAIYLSAREQFKNDYLFLSELILTYIKINEYEKAANEILMMVEKNPNRLDIVQRQFSRVDDELLYDEVIFVLENQGLTKSRKSDVFTKAKQELLLWLLLQRNVYQRAIAMGKWLEGLYPNEQFVLTVSQNLLFKDQFELADEALAYYKKRDNLQKWIFAKELQVRVFYKWAQSIEQNGIEFLGKSDSLYQAAEETLLLLVNEPRVDTRSEMYTQLIDIYLSKLVDVEKARSTYESYKKLDPRFIREDENAYLEGRFHMLDGSFREARIALTKANRTTKNAELLEKSRYFLALNDFYTKEFDYSSIQLKSVELQQTSLYANDAIKLRNTIRKGTKKDSVLSELVYFSDALYALERQEYQSVEQIITSHMEEMNALLDDAARILVKVYRRESIQKAYQWLVDYQGTATNEQLYFDKLALMYQMDEFSETDQISEYTRFLKMYPNSYFAETIRKFISDAQDI